MKSNQQEIWSVWNNVDSAERDIVVARRIEFQKVCPQPIYNDIVTFAKSADVTAGISLCIYNYNN